MSNNRYFSLFFAWALSLFTTSCGTGSESSHWLRPGENLHVLATTEMIAAVVSAVGQEQVDLTCLIANQLDPHSYELVKGDDEKLARADLIFYNGLGLEHGASLKRFLSRSEKAFNVGQFIVEKAEGALILTEGKQDPHIWMDISLWAKMIPLVVEACAEKRPEHAALFQRNGLHLLEQLEQAHMTLQNLMQEIPEEKRYLITSHDAFRYFTRAYLATQEERENGGWQVRCIAPEGLAPEGQISVQDIRAVVNDVKRYHISVLFFESNVSKASLTKILDATKQVGLQLQLAKKPLYGDAMGPRDSESGRYPGMVLYDGAVMHQAWMAQ